MKLRTMRRRSFRRTPRRFTLLSEDELRAWHMLAERFMLADSAKFPIPRATWSERGGIFWVGHAQPYIQLSPEPSQR